MEEATTTVDLGTIAEKAGRCLRERKQTIAVAESSSGGFISGALLAVPGASTYFKGGGVVYTMDAKRDVLRLTSEAIAEAPTATEIHATHLARAAKARFGADWGIGETGAAGPTGNKGGTPPGTACVAVAGPDGIVLSREIRTGCTNRFENMMLFTAAAIETLETALGS